MAEKKKIDKKKVKKVILTVVLSILAFVVVGALISSIVMRSIDKKQLNQEENKYFTVEASKSSLYEGERNIIELTVDGNVTFADTITDDMFTASSFYDAVTIKSTRVSDQKVSLCIDGLPFDNNSEVFCLAVAADAFKLDAAEAVSLEFECLHPELEYSYENVFAFDIKDGKVVYVSDISLPEGFSFDEKKFNVADGCNYINGWDVSNEMLIEGKLFLGLTYIGDDFYQACLSQDFDIPVINEHGEEVYFNFSLKNSVPQLSLIQDEVDYDAKTLKLVATVINGKFTKPLAYDDFIINISDNVKNISVAESSTDSVVFNVQYEGDDEELLIDISLKSAENVTAMIAKDSYSASFSGTAYNDEKGGKRSFEVMWNPKRRQLLVITNKTEGTDKPKEEKKDSNYFEDLLTGFVKDGGKSVTKKILGGIQGEIVDIAASYFFDLCGITQESKKPSEVQKALAETLEAISYLSGGIAQTQQSIEELGYKIDFKTLFTNNSVLNSKLSMIKPSESCIKYLDKIYDTDADKKFYEELDAHLSAYRKKIEALEEERYQKVMSLNDKNHAYKMEQLYADDDYKAFLNALSEEGKAYCTDNAKTYELYERVLSMYGLSVEIEKLGMTIFGLNNGIDKFNEEINKYFVCAKPTDEIWGKRSPWDLPHDYYSFEDCPEMQEVKELYKTKSDELYAEYQKEKSAIEAKLGEGLDKSFVDFMDSICRYESCNFAEFMIMYADDLLFRDKNVDEEFAELFTEDSLPSMQYDGSFSAYISFLDSKYNFESETILDKQKFILKTYSSYMLGGAVAVDYCNAKYKINPNEYGGMLVLAKKIAVQMSLVQNMVERELDKIERAIDRAQKNKDVILVSNQVVSKTVHRALTYVYEGWLQYYRVAGYGEDYYEHELDYLFTLDFKSKEEKYNPTMARKLTGIKGIAIAVSQETYMQMCARAKKLGYSSLISELNNNGFKTPCYNNEDKVEYEAIATADSGNTYFYMDNIKYSSQYKTAAFFASAFAGIVGYNSEQGWKIKADVYDVLTGKSKKDQLVLYNYNDTSVWKLLDCGHRSDDEYLYFFAENDADLWKPYSEK